MAVASGRRPRCVGAEATYLNAGLWGSRFVGECEIGTNGEKVWVRGRRVPRWLALARVVGYTGFLPVGFFSGYLVADTLLGHRGYPPYYYMLASLATLLLVVIGLWGAGIWHDRLGSFEMVSWPVDARRGYYMASAGRRAGGLWKALNRFFSAQRLIQVEVPIGPGGKPRRLVLRAKGVSPESVLAVLSGVYYGQARVTELGPAGAGSRETDLWDWSRN